MLVFAYFLIVLLINAGTLASGSNADAIALSIQIGIPLSMILALAVASWGNINFVGLHRFYRDRLHAEQRRSFNVHRSTAVCGCFQGTELVQPLRFEAATRQGPLTVARSQTLRACQIGHGIISLPKFIAWPIAR
jgi:hypothetical protein